MISKEKLVFDPTDTPDGDKVGAHVLSDDGTAITHHTVGGDEGLDVYLINSSVPIEDGGNSITVDAVDLDIRDLDAASDSVAAWMSDGSGNALSSTSGALHVSDAGGSLTVDATDLDIRDLTASTDSVSIGDGTDTLEINADGSINISDNGGSITVDATDLDIRDLDAASDSVAAWTHDGSGNAITSTTGHLDVNIASSDIEIDVEDDKANTAAANAGLSVDNSAEVELNAGASNLASRRFMFVQNLGNREVYVGATGVTASNGLRLSAGAVAEFRIGPSLSLYAVGDRATAEDVRVLEMS